MTMGICRREPQGRVVQAWFGIQTPKIGTTAGEGQLGFFWCGDLLLSDVTNMQRGHEIRTDRLASEGENGRRRKDKRWKFN